MAYSTPYTFTALELLTAAKMNAIQTNITAMWVGTAAGDMSYYSSATAKTRVAKSTYGKVWRMNSGATAPEWGGVPIATGTAETESSYNWPGPGWLDMTGATLSLTLIGTSTIIALFAGSIISDAGGQIRGNVDGTEDAFEVNVSNSDGYVPFSVISRKATVSSGARTIKLQVRNSGSLTTVVDRCKIIAWAIPE